MNYYLSHLFKVKLPDTQLFLIIFLNIIFGLIYINLLFDMFGFKFFQDSTVIFEQIPSIQFGNSFIAARLLLEPYIMFLEMIGVDIQNYAHYQGIDFVITNSFFCLINSLLYFYFLITIIKKNPPFLMITIYTLLFFLYVPYIGIPGKETNTLALGVIFSYGVLRKNKYILTLSILLIILYAVLGRFYYLIFLLVSFILTRVVHKKFLLFATIGLFVITFYFALNIEIIKESLILSRPEILKELSNSYIEFLYPDDSPLSMLINRVYLFILMIFPFPLLEQAKWIPYFILGMIYSGYMLFYINSKNHVNRFFAVGILSFLISQALFEPDYGSVFRHRAFILPFLLYLINDSLKNKKIIKKENHDTINFNTNI